CFLFSFLYPLNPLISTSLVFLNSLNFGKIVIYLVETSELGLNFILMFGENFQNNIDFWRKFL
ncbi:MAG: hypothetical protein ACP5PT_06750, partial [Brevinematia bacterium]